MKRPIFLTAIMMPLSLFASEIRFVGTAQPVEGGDTLYTESHAITGTCTGGQFRPAEHSVEYRRPDSDPFATKKLSYRHSALRPGVVFEQPEFSEVIEIENRNDKTLEITWQPPSGSVEESTLEVTSSLVADAGFDNFVRQNWKKVVANGDSVKFDMVAPTRGDHYGFTLEPASDSRIEADHLLRIRPSSMLMGFLVDPIMLGYNDDGLLTDYLGLTNIRKNEDGNFVAHIRYEIQAAPDCELTR